MLGSLAIRILVFLSFLKNLLLLVWIVVVDMGILILWNGGAPGD